MTTSSWGERLALTLVVLGFLVLVIWGWSRLMRSGTESVTGAIEPVGAIEQAR